MGLFARERQNKGVKPRQLLQGKASRNIKHEIWESHIANTRFHNPNKISFFRIGTVFDENRGAYLLL